MTQDILIFIAKFLETFIEISKEVLFFVGTIAAIDIALYTTMPKKKYRKFKKSFKIF